MYWFGAVKYNIGGFDFSANDIEHGVLRANAASPSSLGSLLGRPDWARGQFKAGDPRLALVRLPCWSLAAIAGQYRRGQSDCKALWSGASTGGRLTWINCKQSLCALRTA
jgi:hypothetical protein